MHSGKGMCAFLPQMEQGERGEDAVKTCPSLWWGMTEDSQNLLKLYGMGLSALDLGQETSNTPPFPIDHR